MKKAIETQSKLHTDVVRIGSKNVDHYDLTAIEAVAMTVVSVLSITAGTIYGTMLF